MTKVQNTNVSAVTQVENKKVKKQQQKKEQKVFKGDRKSVGRERVC